MVATMGEESVVVAPAPQETLEARRDNAGNVIIDGPSQTLLVFMGKHNFVAPADWQGCRELTDK